MEFGAMGRPGGHGGGVKDEKRSESSGGGGGGDEGRHEEEAVDNKGDAQQVANPVTAEISIVETVPIAPTKNEEVDELESTMAEMGEVREENQRLKMSLDRLLKDYKSLQMQFQDMVQQETKRSADKENNDSGQELTEESELVSLSLGRVPCNPKGDDQTSRVSKQLKGEEFKEELSLGLDCKFETTKSGGTGSTTETLPIPSPTNSSEVPKEEAGETWPPSKGLKNLRDNNIEDEVSQQNPAKKPRVCVRARCDTTTMSDGCQWRKYGQKIAKGNPCPRAYYRCTVAPSCPVRKQVQRCVEDMSILITTYEGTHNHPLPLAATAIASTTSAAASMLLSGSSTSRSTDLHGLNLYLSDNGSKPKQFYLSNPALSSTPSHPTITLDLTSSNPASSHFGRIFPTNYNPPRYSSSSTSLSFNTSSQSNAMSWSNGFLSYGAQPQHQSYNNRNPLSTINLGRSQQPILENNNIFQSYMLKNNTSTPPPPPSSSQAQRSLPDHTIEAATKAITADPTFQSALAAALTSIIGTGSNGIGGMVQLGNQGQSGVDKMKWGELFPTTTSTSKVNGCASSFLNKTPTNAPTAGLTFLPPSTLAPFASSKSASASPNDDRDTTK